ncbi:hypothetical protein J2Z70_000275 [Paenibacillus silagei]|uniref:Uncharacterized protein n=1 Tax=Paenibacillus silagei TaxID=1670801 RepID=A0ABS4NKX3_9BACL|nr:hypothetical protein [Paenibacillus silagei]
MKCNGNAVFTYSYLLFLSAISSIIYTVSGSLDKVTEFHSLNVTLCLMWDSQATCNMLINPTWDEE